MSFFDEYEDRVIMREFLDDAPTTWTPATLRNLKGRIDKWMP